MIKFVRHGKYNGNDHLRLIWLLLIHRRVVTKTTKPAQHIGKDTLGEYVRLLQRCTQKKALSEGKLIHARINVRGLAAIRILQNVIVNMYVKCGSMADARRFFDGTAERERDVRLWTVMISAYVRQGSPQQALALFHQMHTAGVQPNHFTLSSVISACTHLASLQQGMEIHERVVRSGFNSHVSVCNALVDLYAKRGNRADARQVFDRMSQRDIVSWTVMIAAYAREGPLEEALALFHRMQESGVQSNQFAFSAVISACAGLGSLEHGVEIHEEIIRKGCESHISVANALVDMYVKCGSLAKARELFDKMSQRDVVSWTVMVAAYAKHGPPEEALSLFRQMEERGCMPNELTFASVLSAVAALRSLKLGIDFHEKIIKSGLQSHVSVANGLVDMYAKCGSIEKAWDLFDKMPRRDVVSWNSMITGFAQNGLVEEALKMFEQMPQRDLISWNAMIAGLIQNGFVDRALKLFKEMPQKGVISWTAMIAGYAQVGHLDEALKLFNEMTLRDTVSWNAMIAGCGQNGYDEEALKLFQQMQFAGVRPDSKTFANVLPACAKLAALKQGTEIHEKIISSGFHLDTLVANALIHMYAKCGDIQNANEIFGRMHLRDSVSWTSMITGFAMHGYGKKALKLFEQMRLSGMTPDHITFLSVLSACNHAGLVDDGYKYFNCMTKCYHITPTMEHYRCIVDLLGRAGHLDEAQDFIHKMPIKPDAAVWNCLLGACRIHNNVELGEYVAGQIFELDPRNAVPYVLLSNIYAAAGKWSEIGRVRKMMKDRGVKKTPGCSWIEVNRQENAFVVRDMSHMENQRNVGDTVLENEGSRSIPI